MITTVHSIQINILFEDNHLLVVEKPVNIPTQADESKDMDLLSLLKEDIKIRYQKPGNVYLGLVHRLDRPVGGIMVFAKTSKAASRLSEQVREHTFKKQYLAITHSEIKKKSDRLVHYLLKDTKTNTVKSVNKSIPGAKEAILEYDVLDSKQGFSLVKINLLTGRSHQIRVQFSSIGHPLYGDQKYGSHINKPGQQIALWSHEIALLHPTSKEELKFQCSPPNQLPWNVFAF